MTQVSRKILLISGSGRNVGKTSFMRRVIAQNASHQLVAIKITPHFHEPTSGLTPLFVSENYRIFQETDATSGKDSSLFLQAGAESVFYIQTTDAYLEEAFNKATEHLLPIQPILVESAVLRTILVPQLYLFIQKNYEEVKPSAVEMQKLADLVVYSDSGQFSMDPALITFDEKWNIPINDNA
jgi:molybdopterin-guanine dinucleotide biosynthesis protein